MDKTTEPAMPYEATFKAFGGHDYWCRVLEPVLDTAGAPVRDMRYAEFANGVRWTVPLGQLDWDDR